MFSVTAARVSIAMPGGPVAANAFGGLPWP